MTVVLDNTHREAVCRFRPTFVAVREHCRENLDRSIDFVSTKLETILGGLETEPSAFQSDSRKIVEIFLASESWDDFFGTLKGNETDELEAGTGDGVAWELARWWEDYVDTGDGWGRTKIDEILQTVHMALYSLKTDISPTNLNSAVDDCWVKVRLPASIADA